MHFFHFPYKDVLRCKKWASNSGNLSFLSLPDNKLRNKVVCEIHFVEKAFMNFKKERLVKTAVPTQMPLKNGEMAMYNCTDDEAENMVYPQEAEDIDLPGDESSVTKSPTLLNKWQEPIENVQEPAMMAPKRKAAMVKRSFPINKQSKLEEKIEFINTDSAPSRVDESVFQVSLDLDPINTTVEAKPKILRPKIIKMRSQPVIKQELPSPQKSPATTILNNIKISTLAAMTTTPVQRRISYGARKNTEKSIKVLESTVISPADISETAFTVSNASASTIEAQSSKLEDMSKQIEELKALLTAKASSENTSPALAAAAPSMSQFVKVEKGPALTKIQLFNGMRKYLNPSMVALLRMEMFGSTEREYRPDEKQFSKELYNLNESVYDYMRDEWRFRLPAKSVVKSWLENQDDEDNWELC